MSGFFSSTQKPPLLRPTAASYMPPTPLPTSLAPPCNPPCTSAGRVTASSLGVAARRASMHGRFAQFASENTRNETTISDILHPLKHPDKVHAPYVSQVQPGATWAPTVGAWVVLLARSAPPMLTQCLALPRKKTFEVSQRRGTSFLGSSFGEN